MLLDGVPNSPVVLAWGLAPNRLVPVLELGVPPNAEIDNINMINIQTVCAFMILKQSTIISTTIAEMKLGNCQNTMGISENELEHSMIKCWLHLSTNITYITSHKVCDMNFAVLIVILKVVLRQRDHFSKNIFGSCSENRSQILII